MTSLIHGRTELICTQEKKNHTKIAAATPLPDDTKTKNKMKTVEKPDWFKTAIELLHSEDYNEMRRFAIAAVHANNSLEKALAKAEHRRADGLLDPNKAKEPTDRLETFRGGVLKSLERTDLGDMPTGEAYKGLKKACETVISTHEDIRRTIENDKYVDALLAEVAEIGNFSEVLDFARRMGSEE